MTELLNTCKDTLIERKHELISQIIKKGLCKVLRFEASSVLYYDRKEDILFSVSHDTSYDGITFIKEVIQYPSTLGITGSVMRRTDKDVFVFHHTKKNGLYKPEIDNITGVHEVRDMVLGVLRSKKKVVGIVQLVNKNTEDDGISAQDQHLIESILPVLAAGICNAHDFN